MKKVIMSEEGTMMFVIFQWGTNIPPEIIAQGDGKAVCEMIPVDPVLFDKEKMMKYISHRIDVLRELRKTQ
jgi:hypothetical protein